MGLFGKKMKKMPYKIMTSKKEHSSLFLHYTPMWRHKNVRKAKSAVDAIQDSNLLVYVCGDSETLPEVREYACQRITNIEDLYRVYDGMYGFSARENVPEYVKSCIDAYWKERIDNMSEEEAISFIRNADRYSYHLREYALRKIESKEGLTDLATASYVREQANKLLKERYGITVMTREDYMKTPDGMITYMMLDDTSEKEKIDCLKRLVKESISETDCFRIECMKNKYPSLVSLIWAKSNSVIHREMASKEGVMALDKHKHPTRTTRIRKIGGGKYTLAGKGMAYCYPGLGLRSIEGTEEIMCTSDYGLLYLGKGLSWRYTEFSKNEIAEIEDQEYKERLIAMDSGLGRSG